MVLSNAGAQEAGLLDPGEHIPAKWAGGNVLRGSVPTLWRDVSRHSAELECFKLLRQTDQRDFIHLLEFHHPIIQLIQNGIARLGGLLRFGFS